MLKIRSLPALLLSVVFLVVFALVRTGPGGAELGENVLWWDSAGKKEMRGRSKEGTQQGTYIDVESLHARDRLEDARDKGGVGHQVGQVAAAAARSWRLRRTLRKRGRG